MDRNAWRQQLIILVGVLALSGCACAPHAVSAGMMAGVAVLTADSLQVVGEGFEAVVCVGREATKR